MMIAFRLARAFAAGLALCCMGAASAHAAPGCPAIPARSPMPRDAVAENLDIPEWREKSAQISAQLAGKNLSGTDIVFIGDSITQGWDPVLFHNFYGGRTPLNLGLWGDFTQGALWRLSHGQWGNLRPKLAVLLIGTNNTQWNGRPEDVALGIAELVRFIQSRSPRTKVLLLGILPRGPGPSEPLRAVNARVNTLVARCADDQNTFFLDVGSLFLGPGRVVSEQILFDYLHPTPVGYAILATAIEPLVRRILGD